MAVDRISIVVPCHNEQECLDALYDALCRVLEPFVDWEIILVDDGSTDQTLSIMRELHRKDSRVRYISFLQNYGHQKALIAGLRQCRFDYAVSLDADLQHPPEIIPEFIEMHKQTQADVVVGQRTASQQGALKGLCSKAFYPIFEIVTGVPITPGVSDFRFYTRRALDVLCSIREPHPFLRGMIPLLGLPMAIVPYDLNPRYGGPPSYSLRKSAKMAIQALLRFSELPERLGLLLGVMGVILSIGFAMHYLYLRLFTDSLVPGQADLMVFLGLISSTILVTISLLLRMTNQILKHLRQEPLYIIRESTTEKTDGPL